MTIIVAISIGVCIPHLFIIIDPILVPIIPKTRVVGVRIFGVIIAIPIAVGGGLGTVIDAITIPILPKIWVVEVRIPNVADAVSVRVPSFSPVTVAVVIPVVPKIRIAWMGVVFLIRTIIIPVTPTIPIPYVTVIGVIVTIAVS
ncbi:hypothetical protein, partial [Prosthecobacter debontii]|uniref:hypothetical protein n=1 Tax=Prosthecobacter debontii TaxID=48467 RepID=UPI001C376694